MQAAETTPGIKIDLASIPAEVQERLAAETVRFARDFLTVPGNRDLLDVWVEEYRQERRSAK